MPRWAWFFIAMAIFYGLACLPPSVLGTLLGVVVIVAEVVFVIGGFFYFLKFNDVMPPLVVLGILAVLCFIWPSLLGIVLGLGMLGGLTFIFMAGLGFFE